jgi:GNAT superfamily N-acetyltransferase
MMPHIRSFAESDCLRLVEILERNGQYSYPVAEGPEAMCRFAACDVSIFLVAECDGQIQGFIRAIYDGSRALIHLMSVNPEVQGRGIGGALLAATEAELSRRGASGASVTATENSAGFWEKHGYGHLPVHLMLKTKFISNPGL